MEDFADMNAMFEFKPPPETISPVEKLLNGFEAHEAKEARAVEYYKRTLANMPSPVARFVMQLIVSDEEKHRAVIHAMVSTLEGSLTWTKPQGCLEGLGDLPALKDDLAQVTDELIHLEKSGIREYKNLAQESNGYYHGLFTILLDVLIRDSQKHVKVLEFLKENLETS